MNFCTFFTDDRNPIELDKLNSTLRKFWEVDNASTCDNVKYHSIIEKSVIEKTEQNIEFDKMLGYYTVKIPWKQEPCLPDNYDLAMLRLQCTEKKLSKNPIVYSSYKSTIENYTKKHYISKADINDNEKRWYLPHVPVLQSDQSNTKIRIVFDASAKYKDTSLNDIIYQGPKLQNEIFDVLLRFRRYPTALVCDIQEVYLRIGIISTNRKFHNFCGE